MPWFRARRPAGRNLRPGVPGDIGATAVSREAQGDVIEWSWLARRRHAPLARRAAGAGVTVFYMTRVDADDLLFRRKLDARRPSARGTGRMRPADDSVSSPSASVFSAACFGVVARCGIGCSQLSIFVWQATLCAADPGHHPGARCNVGVAWPTGHRADPEGCPVRVSVS